MLLLLLLLRQWAPNGVRANRRGNLLCLSQRESCRARTQRLASRRDGRQLSVVAASGAAHRAPEERPRRAARSHSCLFTCHPIGGAGVASETRVRARDLLSLLLLLLMLCCVTIHDDS